MHFRMFVTFDKDKAENSEKARNYAYSELSDDNSFCGDGGRFGSPLADWFVIGGRWSGELAYALNGFMDEVKKIPAFSGQFYGYNEPKKHTEELQAIWEKLGGKGTNPMNRDSYSDNGAEDDAMIVTQEIWDKLLKEYEGEDYSDHFADLDWDTASEEFIGKKWVVVVDYHS